MVVFLVFHTVNLILRRGKVEIQDIFAQEICFFKAKFDESNNENAGVVMAWV